MKWSFWYAIHRLIGSTVVIGSYEIIGGVLHEFTILQTLLALLTECSECIHNAVETLIIWAPNEWCHIVLWIQHVSKLAFVHYSGYFNREFSA